ncbi:DUF5959 family protein [Streptomyces hygroscopicus]|uniref:DUF5959 family protein n=1 Tax=Streptomyces hygroscopicus TaxID=1912 RepID=UPI0032DA81E6
MKCEQGGRGGREGAGLSVAPVATGCAYGRRWLPRLSGRGRCLVGSRSGQWPGADVRSRCRSSRTPGAGHGRARAVRVAAYHRQRGGGVAVHLNDSCVPGIPDVEGQLMVHNDFVTGIHDTSVEPRDLAGWAYVLDEVEAGREAVWREAARVAEIGIRLDWREDDHDRITVTVADQQTTRLAISLHMEHGWIDEQRALLDRLRTAWAHLIPGE